MTDASISSLQNNGKETKMENNPFDTVGGKENTGNTEDRTIMMNSLKDFHTGEVEQNRHMTANLKMMMRAVITTMQKTAMRSPKRNIRNILPERKREIRR